MVLDPDNVSKTLRTHLLPKDATGPVVLYAALGASAEVSPDAIRRETWPYPLFGWTGARFINSEAVLPAPATCVAGAATEDTTKAARTAMHNFMI
jgi:hypothetical protein